MKGRSNKTNMKDKSELLRNLPQFIGTEAYHRFSKLFPKTVLTDGVLYLADNAACYWLMDIIGSIQSIPEVKSEWLLKVTYNKAVAWVIVDDGNGNVLYKQKIASSTFPLDEIQLFVTEGEDGLRVVMLPSEY